MTETYECRLCGSRIPRENEGDYEGLCPECSLELEDFGIDPEDADEFLSGVF